jgi:outer membrane protein assembly factor BamB
MFQANPRHTSFVQGPFVAGDPKHQRALEGQSASISFKIAGSGNIRWFKDGSELPAQNSSILTIPAVTLQDAGEYHLVIDGAFRSSTSAPVRLEVNVPGTLAWATPLTNGVWNYPILSSSNRVTLSSLFTRNAPESIIQTFDREDGRPVWEQTAPGLADITSDPSGRIVATVEQGALYVLRADTGAQLWQTNGSPWEAAVSDTVTYTTYATNRYGYPQTNFLALATDSGELLWNIEMPAHLTGPVTLLNDDLLVPAQTNIYRMTAQGSELILLTQSPWPVWDIAIGNQGHFYIMTRSNLASYHPASDKVLWNYPFESTPLGLAIDSAERVVLSTSQSLFCLDGLTGKIIWSILQEDGFYTPPTLGTGEIYVADYDGVLAIETATGKTKWRYYTDETTSKRLLLDESGRLYIAEPKRLLALDGVRPLEKSTWPIQDSNPRGSRYVRLSPTPAPAIQLSLANAQMVLTFDTLPGKTCHLHESSDLREWTIVKTLTAQSSQSSFELDPGSSNQKFFKISVD